MSSLSETVKRGLQFEREMAIAANNQPRLAYLNAEIAKLQSQITKADLHERDLILRREMGITE